MGINETRGQVEAFSLDDPPGLLLNMLSHNHYATSQDAYISLESWIPGPIYNDAVFDQDV